MMFALDFFLARTIFGDVGLHFREVSSVGYVSDVFHTQCFAFGDVSSCS